MHSKGSIYKTVDFFEQDYQVKTLTTKFELEEAYAFRHKIFVEELGWVSPQRNGLDKDRYDDTGMAPLGVFDRTEGRLIAHLRITLPHRIFMMDKEFASLIEIPIIKTDGTVEVSRVCTEKKYRKTQLETIYGSYHIAMLLYKGLYQWCTQNSLNDMYMVIEYKLLRLLKLLGFPCSEIGKSTIMPDGVSAVAVRIDWREFEMLNKNNKPQLLGWFRDICYETRVAA